jgi:hypothetical protein
MADVALQDLKMYSPLVVNDQGNNGGHIDLTDQLISGALESTFDDVPSDERETGSDKDRKVFLAVQSNNNGSTMSNHVWLHVPTPGEDWAVFYPATVLDTAATVAKTTPYGAGVLASSVSIGATQVVITVEDSSLSGIFRNGEKFIISNKEFASSTTNNAEKRTANAVPGAVGTQVTITFDEPLTKAFAAGSMVSSIYEPGTISASVSGSTVTSTAGTFDDTKVTLNNIGCTSETLTLTMSSATAFTAVGSISGALAAGSTVAEYAPTNPTNGSVLATIPTTAFGGAYVNGDTIEIVLIGAYFAVFENRIIPALCGSVSSNKIHLAWSCESS